MTDDEILAAAERIKARRLNEKRLDSFMDAKKVMIRWDIPGAPFGESYTGITVDGSEVIDVVVNHFKPLIRSTPSTPTKKPTP